MHTMTEPCSDHGLALRRRLLFLLHLLEFLRFVAAVLLDRLGVVSCLDDQPWSALVDAAATDRLMQEAVWEPPSSPPTRERSIAAPRYRRWRAAPAQDGGSAGTICTICLVGLEEAGGYQVTELCNCSHAFHAACIDAWIGSSEAAGTCPLCRTPVYQRRGTAGQKHSHAQHLNE